MRQKKSVSRSAIREILFRMRMWHRKETLDDVNIVNLKLLQLQKESDFTSDPVAIMSLMQRGCSFENHSTFRFIRFFDVCQYWKSIFSVLGCERFYS